MYKIASYSNKDEARNVLKQIYDENPKYWPHGLNIEGMHDLYLVKDASNNDTAGFVGWQQLMKKDKNHRLQKVGSYVIGILPKYRNCGFAKEAVAKIINMKSASVDRVEAAIVETNTPSIALAKALDIPNIEIWKAASITKQADKTETVLRLLKKYLNPDIVAPAVAAPLAYKYLPLSATGATDENDYLQRGAGALSAGLLASPSLWRRTIQKAMLKGEHKIPFNGKYTYIHDIPEAARTPDILNKIKYVSEKYPTQESFSSAIGPELAKALLIKAAPASIGLGYHGYQNLMKGVSNLSSATDPFKTTSTIDKKTGESYNSNPLLEVVRAANRTVNKAEEATANASKQIDPKDPNSAVNKIVNSIGDIGSSANKGVESLNKGVESVSKFTDTAGPAMSQIGTAATDAAKSVEGVNKIGDAALDAAKSVGAIGSGVSSISVASDSIKNLADTANTAGRSGADKLQRLSDYISKITPSADTVSKYAPYALGGAALIPAAFAIKHLMRDTPDYEETETVREKKKTPMRKQQVKSAADNSPSSRIRNLRDSMKDLQNERKKHQDNLIKQQEKQKKETQKLQDDQKAQQEADAEAKKPQSIPDDFYGNDTKIPEVISSVQLKSAHAYIKAAFVKEICSNR